MKLVSRRLVFQFIKFRISLKMFKNMFTISFHICKVDHCTWVFELPLPIANRQSPLLIRLLKCKQFWFPVNRWKSRSLHTHTDRSAHTADMYSHVNRVAFKLNFSLLGFFFFCWLRKINNNKLCGSTVKFMCNCWAVAVAVRSISSWCRQ